MRSNESKIPLVVAALILGYIVFWGLGYAKNHQQQAPAPPPAVVVQTPPPAEVRPARVLPSQANEPQPSNPTAVANNSETTQDEPQHTGDENGDPVYLGKPGGIQNKKMIGMTQGALQRR